MMIDPLKRKARRQEQEEARKAAANTYSSRNDALLSSVDFCEFLTAVANRAGYLNASVREDDWNAGYHAALRDLVNGVVRNSVNGSKWLQNYVADKAIKPSTGE